MSVKELRAILNDKEEIKSKDSKWEKKNKYYQLVNPNKIHYMIDEKLIKKMKNFAEDFQELSKTQQKKVFEYVEPKYYIIYCASQGRTKYYGYTSKTLCWTLKVSLFSYFQGSKGIFDNFKKPKGVKIELVEVIKTKSRSVVNARKKYHEINNLPKNKKVDKLIAAIRRYFDKKDYKYSNKIYFYLIKENKKNDYVLGSGTELEDTKALMIAMKNKEFSDKFDISKKYGVSLVGIQKVKSKLELLIKLDFYKYYFKTLKLQHYNIAEFEDFIDNRVNISDKLTIRANKEIKKN